MRWALKRRRTPEQLPQDAVFSDGRSVRDVLAVHLGEALERAEILNYHGLLSLFVETPAGRYKVAECESVRRAELAEEALSAVKHAGGPVPGLVARDGAVLIADWVEGPSCRKEPKARQREVLLQCQTALYRTPVPPGSNAGYVHMETLARRFRRLGPEITSESRVESILAALWEHLPEPAEPAVLHPDLTPANVVLSDRGPVIIDNEVISIGSGLEWDVWNSGEALCGPRHDACIESYVSSFATDCPYPRLFEYRAAWDRFRLLRRMLKAIEKRRLFKARRLLRRLASGL